MRRLTLLLMIMATALLAASGIAWAGVTKSCPAAPKVCAGTSGNDVLKSTSKANDMRGKAGNDTYTNFVKDNFNQDIILDSKGKDKLMLTNYSENSAKFFLIDLNENGNPDSLLIEPGKSTKHWVGIVGYFDDTRSEHPFRAGPGFIEEIRFKAQARTATEASEMPHASEASADQVAEFQASLR